MKFAVIFLAGLMFSQAHADDMAMQCASLQMQVEQFGEQAARDMGLGGLIDMCAEEDTASYREGTDSGTLYCQSGGLCASYDFTHASDRALYVSSCAQVAGCPSDYTDKCTVTNDPVRNGVGTADWTIYSYGVEMPPEAKAGHCD